MRARLRIKHRASATRCMSNIERRLEGGLMLDNKIIYNGINIDELTIEELKNALISSFEFIDELTKSEIELFQIANKNNFILQRLKDAG